MIMHMNMNLERRVGLELDKLLIALDQHPDLEHYNPQLCVCPNLCPYS